MTDDRFHRTDAEEVPERAPARILVVDDEPDLAELIRQKFRRHVRRGDFEFLFANDGEEALQILREQPGVDLVLTDVNMPRMDGLTLLAELAKLQHEAILGAVVVTAYSDMLNIRMAMNRGAYDFLTKPIDLDDLEVTIEKAVAMVREQKRAVHARQTVGRYLSDEVAETLLANPEATELGGERRRVTILMSDLRGFSALSERLPPERVVEVLNVYLGVMGEVITEFGGTIDEFLGDGILVIFGAPGVMEDHARRAVACALAMQQAMGHVNERVRVLGLPPLRMGIGINTGEVVVGTIGSEKRAKYAVVGSPVNLTGRIEAATIGGQILVTASTRAEAGGDVAVRRTLELAAKGFSEPIPLFEIAAIGPPYDLHLDSETAPLTFLPEPLAVRFHLLVGKQLADEAAAAAELVALSDEACLLRTDHPLDLLADLMLRVPTPGGTGNAYAKVLEATDDGWLLHFTAVPTPVAESLRVLQENAA